MKKYFLWSVMLLMGLLLQPVYGADELSSVVISDARMPIYNNNKLTILAYSKTANRLGADIILKNAIMDLIKTGVNVDQVKYIDGSVPYQLNASLKKIITFWASILHSDGLIFSDTATINQKTKNARSRGKIYFRSPIMDVNGVGFRANFAKRTVHILKDVIIKIRQLDNGKGKSGLLASKKNAGKRGTSTITADQMFIDFINNIITVSGNVKVDEENITINCEKITVYLKQGAKSKTKKRSGAKQLGSLSSSSSRKVSRILCQGNVVITRKQSASEIKQNGLQQAFADQADYDFAKSKIVMTGKHPTIKRGADRIEGKQITIWRDKEHLLAEGDCRLSFMAPTDKKVKKGATPAKPTKPTVATSDFMDMDYAKNLAVLTGNVQVVDSRMKIDCHKMNIYLEERHKVIKNKNKSKTKKVASKSVEQSFSGSKGINKIVCLGNVTIVRLDGKLKDGTQKATAGKAIYQLKAGKIILSENNPMIIRGRDSIKGDTITVWVDQQRMHVDKNSVIVLNNLKNSKGRQPAATKVNSDYTNINYGKNIMSFAGQVKVNNPQMALDCKKMLIFLEDKPGTVKSNKTKKSKSADPFAMKSSAKEVSKVICLGDVYARDLRNDVKCQKLTLIMQDKKPGVVKTAKTRGKNSNFGGNREISRIICKEDVVMIRRPAAVAKQKSSKSSSPTNVAGKLLAGGSDKPITVKTDLMDLKLSENYGELIGNVDVDEPRARLTCDKMELYANNTTPTNPLVKKNTAKAQLADDEFENEAMDIDEVADGEGSVPKKISLGDDKELDKIVCLKNVVIIKKTVGAVPIKQQATGDKAVYFIKKGKIELTEKPKVYQGDRVVHGHKITLWTNSERLDIERGDVKEFELPD
jgi:lipopolysaccharide export system protein LptA